MPVISLNVPPAAAQSCSFKFAVAKAGRDEAVANAIAAEATNKAFFNIITPENLL
ncbi:MAG: hypothetical protein ACKO3K_16240 [Cuspidothrix sp.]